MLGANSLIKWLPFLRSINQAYKISPPNSWHWFISFRLAKLWMHPVYVEVELIRSEVVDQKRITNRAKETENVGEVREGVRKKGEGQERSQREREREREREKPDSAPPYATTCIDRGLCHWIPPVVGRFLSLLLSYFLHTMSRSDSQPTNLIERCSVIETSKIKFAI